MKRRSCTPSNSVDTCACVSACAACCDVQAPPTPYERRIGKLFSADGLELPTGGPRGYWQDWSRLDWSQVFQSSRARVPDAHVEHGIDGYLGGRCFCRWCETQRNNVELKAERERKAAEPPRTPPPLEQPEQQDGIPVGALGNYTNNASGSIKTAAGCRWVFLRAMGMAGLTTGRTAKCRRVRVADRVQVTIHERGVNLAGVMSCGSVWSCPVCAAKIMTHRRGEIMDAVNFWRQQKLNVRLLTLTVSHHYGDDLRKLSEGLANAWRRMTSGRWGKKFRELFPEYIRRLELTHGPNGWHPHLHVLLFQSDVELPAAIEQEISARWASCVTCELGEHAKPTIEQGATFSKTSGTGEYILKLGCEISDIAFKEPAEGHRTPWQLVHSALTGDDQAREYWSQYVEGMWSRRQLTWSRDLRKRTRLGRELSDAEVAASPERVESEVLVADMPGDVWDRRAKHINWVRHLILAAEAKDVDALRVLLSVPVAPEPYKRVHYRIARKLPLRQ